MRVSDSTLTTDSLTRVFRGCFVTVAFALLRNNPFKPNGRGSQETGLLFCMASRAEATVFVSKGKIRGRVPPTLRYPELLQANDIFNPPTNTHPPPTHCKVSFFRVCGGLNRLGKKKRNRKTIVPPVCCSVQQSVLPKLVPHAWLNVPYEYCSDVSGLKRCETTAVLPLRDLLSRLHN